MKLEYVHSWLPIWQLSDPLPEQNVNYFGLFLTFFGQFRPLLWSGSNFVTKNPLLSPKSLTWEYLIKTEWFTYYQCNSYSGPLSNNKVNYFELFFGHFWGRGATCGLETPSWALKLNLGPLNENRVVDYQCNRRRVMILDVFGQFRPLLWPGSHFVICKSPFGP